MTSFQLSITPSRRAAARFVNRVRRTLQEALADQKGLSGITQSEVARRIGVHRSVINRELHGRANITIGRVAEFAHALGLEPRFTLVTPEQSPHTNERSPYVEVEIDASPNRTVRKDQDDSDNLSRVA